MRAAFGALLALSLSFTSANAADLLDQDFRRLAGDEVVNLGKAYSGKVVLVVNTASKCGNTPQYEGLEKLYQEYEDAGLVVLGFPSNDFAQEKSSNQDIAEFCENTFGVKFPMLAASSVKGPQANPFFKHLIAQGATPPRWNFYKYLIGKDGKVVASYGSTTSPQDPRLIRQIEQLVAK